ncbi:unnamed protein product [Cladocopium goreaui]|uniref:EF-hand domain-containing protein n=1 Tax=Cladocopium goreaui TaxID=2562237 RepID=A0A9P1BZG5_9DINO|nr:unnamed protein product [Cladocopium goreaui]
MGMTTEEVVRRAFLNADVDQSGTLDIQEFGRLLQLLNPSTWSQERLQLFFLRADKDGSGRVDLQETLDWLLYGASRRKKEEVAASRPAALDDAVLEDIAERKRRSSEVSRIMKAFDDADFNKDGYLDKEEFARLLMHLDPKRFSDPKKLTSAFLKADNDRSGSLETGEVEAWLREYLAKAGISEEEELYMLLTWRDNRNAGPLRLDDLLGAFQSCTSQGMSARFRGHVPQAVPGFFEPHDVSPMEFVMLFEHLREHRDATDKEIREQLSSYSWRRKNKQEMKRSFSGNLTSLLNSLGHNPNTPVGLGLFKQLLAVLTAILRIDREHMLMFFAWSKTGHFQLTDSIIEKVLEKVFMKVPKSKEPLLSMSVSENDFYRVCFSMDVLDTNGRHGIPRGQIALIFQDILRNMSQKLSDREALKKPFRRKDKSPKKGSKGSSGTTLTPSSPAAIPVCLRHELRGTKEIGLLLEMLWSALPGRPFPTVLDMVMNFLERAAQQAAAPRAASPPAPRAPSPPKAGDED